MAINNETHGVWRFFFHSIELKKKSPLVHRYPTHEVDEPFRWANSFIFRLPWSSKGLVAGWWHKTDRTEEQALIAAMEGRQMAHEEFSETRAVNQFVETGDSGYLDTAFSEIERSHIRRNLIKKQFSAEDQQLLVEVLDL